MAKVPYQPVPQVVPGLHPTPSLRPSAPAEAFGGASARAKQGLGNELQRSADTLFRRAISLQKIENETEALEANNEFIIKSGELKSGYMSLQGKQRVDARGGYVSKLEALQKSISENMSNRASRRIFDAATTPSVARATASAASAAATAHKNWSITTAKAQLELDVNTIAEDPEDSDLFTEKLERIEESARFITSLQGIPRGSAPEKLAVLESTSKAWASRLLGMARTQPFEAAKLLEENRDQLTTADYLRIDSAVITQRRAVGSAQIANEVFDPSTTFEQMEAEAKARADEVAPDDPLLKKQAVTNLRTQYNQIKYAQKQEELEAKQTIAGLIEETRPSTLRELLLSPQAEEAYSRLSEIEQNKIPGQINRYNSAVDKADQEQNFTRLSGMATSDDADAREAFLNLDPTEQNLSQSQMRQVMKMQRAMKEQTSGDPRVVKAVTWLRGAMGSQLEAVGVYRRTADNTEDYDHYVGALQAALDTWQETHGGKPASYDDVVNTIGPQLLRGFVEPNFLGFGGEDPFFIQDVPQDFIDAAKAHYGDLNLPTELIYKLWLKQQFIQLYGAKQKAQPTQEGPVAPISE